MQNKIEQKMKLKPKTQTMASFEYGCLYQMHTICRQRHATNIFSVWLCHCYRRETETETQTKREILAQHFLAN